MYKYHRSLKNISQHKTWENLSVTAAICLQQLQRNKAGRQAMTGNKCLPKVSFNLLLQQSNHVTNISDCIGVKGQ